MSRKYELKVPRFQPYKNIYIGLYHIIKICSKCGGRKKLTPENYDKDYKREYGYHSQCKACQSKYGIKYRLSLKEQ